ncbi:haloacid dehalogenase-like hydrolase family protein [Trichomonas vaginalis G3]|uniref:Haloacid dehalogenase-like hydrolase family protein n=1 Tax=Trichomonas vaginalis (strain ATCC PRA-98 / G3) TaxID=412133 RepID=A2DZV6_TRIV3|nr:pseudouridine 5'-phosphatase protein [Trichomonas vaginalis G3]EAY14015.1 haloacid dehalogenase-like hydrolase family protein [Trichomonas vaginalis G3]KAI5519551.1 pseudouridine 5'-phosphatase protein [Trichomonas vaginalis G3]|eukprot:XP_001326238.1 haloacid dehalogenase-like hydrolase family protein [Trichomonas vaginalis G3]
MLDGIKGVVFDLDGTLIDSMNVWEQSDRDLIESYGHKVPVDFFSSISGMTGIQILEYIIKRFKIKASVQELTQKLLERINYRFMNLVGEKPNSMKFIKYLHDKGIKIAIATNNSRPLTIEILKKFGVYSYVSSIRTCGELKKPKPLPDVYIYACRDLGLDPKVCLSFEDLPVGLQSAQEAGLRTCAVKDAFSDPYDSLKRSIADYYISDFDQVINGTYECLTRTI